MALTGISDELLDEQGREISDVLKEVLEFVKDHVFVGHHVIFDIRFLREAGVSLDMYMSQVRYVDTVALSKTLCHEEVENYRLETLVKKYSIADRQMHRALPDAILAAELYLKLIENQRDS